MTNDPARVFKLNDLLQIANWQEQLEWQPLFEGVEIYRLYENGPEGPRAALLRFSPGGRVASHEHAGYEHILVLDGEQSDDAGKAGPGTLTISPPGTQHNISSEKGCIVLAIYEKPVKFLN